MITKERFAELFLSRYMALNEADRFCLFETLILAHEDIKSKYDSRRFEDCQEFEEWAKNVAELLFPEDCQILFGSIEGLKDDK